MTTHRTLATNFCRAAVIALVVALSNLVQAAAYAQDWPARPVTIVVPFAAGGTADLVARPIAQGLTEKFGQQFVVENKAGAGGTVAAGIVAKAPPDGYTIFFSTIAHTIAPSLYKTLTYDFEKDFEPVTIAAKVPNVLIVNPSVPAKSVGELIAYIKANPGKVNFGSAGLGSTEHMSGEMFRASLGVDVVHVPYKGGAPMMTDLVAGQIQMAIETSGSALPHIQGGTVRALAVSTMVRSPYFPDLPTLNEAGLKDYEITTWYGILFPKGTPLPIRDRLYAAVVDVLKQPLIASRLKELAAEPGGQPPAEFAKFIASETAKWRNVARDANLKAE